MAVQQPLHLTLELGLEGSDAEELDQLTRRFVEELVEQPVESVELASGGAPRPGAKGTDSVTAGAVSVAVLPTVLPKVLDFCQAWALRGQGRTVKFKGRMAGQEVEFEGSGEDLQRLLSALHGLTPTA